MGQGGVTGRICPAWGDSPKGQSWSLGSATACWQGQGNAIRPWEQASCPPLPPLGGYQKPGK